MNIRIYNDIRTPEDFRIWASEFYDPSTIHVEVEDNLFIHLYANGSHKYHLNLRVFNLDEMLSICNELNIKVEKY